MTIPQAADALGVTSNKVKQYLRDGSLICVRDDAGARCVPALFVDEGVLVKHLPAVITQLRDARFADDEIVDWLFRADDTLPGTPIDALRANRGSEVKRRAQAAGF